MINSKNGKDEEDIKGKFREKLTRLVYYHGSWSMIMVIVFVLNLNM
jgi:hypothetical protein